MTIATDRGEIAEVGSPVDVPPDAAVAGRRALRWTTVALATAALALALLDASAIGAWQDGLPPGRAVERMRPAVAAWQRTTDRLRLGAAHGWLHDRWEAMRAARFGNERPGEPGAG